MTKTITKTSDLQEFCQRAAQEKYIVLDTEFMREKTFYSQLCLIQIAIGNDEAIIDPLAQNLDLSPFLQLLANDKITKILHSARQDLEIFYKLLGKLPKPVFDTQIAAMALGFGESISYINLVKGIKGVELDKAARFTDWSKRPLSKNQLEYALADVTHLRDIYPEMLKRLKQKQRTAWVEEEMRLQMDEKLYDFDPEYAWRRLKPRIFKPDYLASLKAVASWREREAKKRDIPRNRIMKDEAIYILAQRKPTSLAGLENIRGIPNGLNRRKSAKSLVNSIKHALENAEIYAPDIKQKQKLPPGIGPTVEMLKTLLGIKTEYAGIAPILIANSNELKLLAAYADKAEIRALEGWRYEVFGQYALKMLAGKIALVLKDGKVVLTDIE